MLEYDIKRWKPVLTCPLSLASTARTSWQRLHEPGAVVWTHAYGHKACGSYSV